MKKERPKRVFKRGKKPLGKTSVKIREKKLDESVIRDSHVSGRQIELLQFLPAIREKVDSQFPKINRFISELHIPLSSSHRKGVRYAWITLFVVGVGVCLWQLFVFGQIAPHFFTLATQRTILEARLNTWESIGNDYQTYRDAHVEGALLAYQLGKQSLVEDEVKKILQIDPNFVLPAELEK